MNQMLREDVIDEDHSRHQGDRQQQKTDRNEFKQEVFQYIEGWQRIHQWGQVVTAQEVINGGDERGVHTGNTEHTESQHRTDQVQRNAAGNIL